MIKTEQINESVTLYCGDCLEIMQAMQSSDVRFNAVITDPPYGIKYQSNMRKASEQFEKIENDEEINSDEWIGDIKSVMTTDSALFMFTRWDVEHIWRATIENAGLNVKSQVIWYKPGGGMGDLYAQYAPDHENAIFAIQGKWKFPAMRPNSVYTFSHDPAVSYVHPSQKPVPLMERVVLDITRKSDLVLDPFMGSGTTGIACIKHGRGFVGVELNEKYFNSAVKRISDMARQPILL